MPETQTLLILAKRIIQQCLAVFALMLLASCASQGNAPIEGRASPPSRDIAFHVVEPGETLYSIAWRYEKDHKVLARLNGIAPPYVIHPGQRLKLIGIERSSTQQELATRSSPPVVQASPTPVDAPVATQNTSVPSTSTRTVTEPQPAVPVNVEGWAWPLDGKILRSFGSSERVKGITLETTGTTDVKAAADGVVVYAGSGVRGYGNFLILKHSDLFLSAYAYNSELIAQEGDSVTQGQLIARSGEDKDGQPRLYFEIRKDGTPVDPVRYLPRR